MIGIDFELAMRRSARKRSREREPGQDPNTKHHCKSPHPRLAFQSRKKQSLATMAEPVGRGTQPVEETFVRPDLHLGGLRYPAREMPPTRLASTLTGTSSGSAVYRFSGEALENVLNQIKKFSKEIPSKRKRCYVV
jgi:hypothetical protein